MLKINWIKPNNGKKKIGGFGINKYDPNALSQTKRKGKRLGKINV